MGLYVSTRGEAPPLSFEQSLLTGLARDGGLYVPASWPHITAEEIAGYAGRPFAGVAQDIIRRFMGIEADKAALGVACAQAYARFAHPATVPLVQIAPNRFILELFHGPTLAFKDVAMQVLARLMDNALEKAGRRATIIGATSGDTGGAAIEAFRHSRNVDLFMLFPDGRVSDVQRRMMTVPTEPHIHAIAVPGTFDDCQNLVKAAFNNHAFRDDVGLAGVNSINWARIVAQIPYYFAAAAALGAPHRDVAFMVPTGNFGDIFAGYAAKRLGLPIATLGIATNANDILARTLETGRYEMRDVVPTQSPSMDIQISSNFERLLFEASERDAGMIRMLMANLKQSGAFTLPEAVLARIRQDFTANAASEAEVAQAIHTTWQQAGYLADPHTATALVAADKADLAREIPVVVLATAAPAKFPEAMQAIAGQDAPLPPHLRPILAAPERIARIDNTSAALEDFVQARRAR